MKSVLAVVLAGGLAATAAAQSSSQAGNPSNAVKPKDAPFLQMISRDNHAEIELAQLAQQKAQDQNVKQYAQKLEQDHKQAQQKLEGVARDAGVNLPTGLTDEQQQTKQKLQQASGSDFDREYIDAMVGGHMAAVAVLTLESQQGDFKGASNFAQEALPTIKGHLQQAEQLKKQLMQQKPSPSQQ
jgi:predicted outer membrane protein